LVEEEGQGIIQLVALEVAAVVEEAVEALVLGEQHNKAFPMD
jgi:hypothetical protein